MEQKPLEGKTCPPSIGVPKNQPAPGPGLPEAAQKTRPFEAKTVEVGAALLSYLLAYFYIAGYAFGDDTFLGWRWGAVLFTFLFWFCTEWFCRLMGRPKAPAESRFWALCMFAIAASQLLWNGRTVVVWDTLILHFVAAYWVLCRAGCLAERGTGPLFPCDALNALFVLPLGNFFLRVRTVWHGLKGKKAGKTAGVVLGTLLVVAPALLFAANQLAQADQGFYALINGFMKWLSHLFSGGVQDVLLRLALSLPVGCFLYGLVAGALRAQGKTAFQAEAAQLRRGAESWRGVPALAVGVSLGAFCCLYLAFFWVQVGYLAGALAGRLPQGFTAAEYARNGFWQLCQIVLLNFTVLLVAAKVCKKPLRQQKALKALALALNGCSGLFAAVALCKMGVYIRYYGLTPNRVLATWFMLVLVCLVVLAGATLVRPFKAVRAAVLLAAGLFAALCLLNPDGWVVRGNLGLYRAGIIRQLDTMTLKECGAARDPQRYARQLQGVGWYVGRSYDEVCWELGRPASLQDGIAMWDLGMGLIDPEVLVVEFRPQAGPQGQPLLVAHSSYIAEGAAAQA